MSYTVDKSTKEKTCDVSNFTGFVIYMKEGLVLIPKLEIKYQGSRRLATGVEFHLLSLPDGDRLQTGIGSSGTPLLIGCRSYSAIGINMDVYRYFRVFVEIVFK